MKNQLSHMLAGNNFSRLSIELYGAQADNPQSQQQGTVALRIFAQARQKQDIERSKFRDRIYALRMQSYPGYHMNLDFRTMEPRPFMEMFPAVIPLSLVPQRVELSSGMAMSIDPTASTAEYPTVRASEETKSPIDLLSLGPTEFVPLGSVVHARSGDKADNTNVGFFVRHGDEYPWLCTLLTVDKLKQLLGDDWHKGKTDRRVERIEFRNINAVHL
jgi:hypothetical protein